MNVLTCYFQGKIISYIENPNTKKMTTFDVYERLVETNAKGQCENDGCQQLVSFKQQMILVSRIAMVYIIVANKEIKSFIEQTTNDKIQHDDIVRIKTYNERYLVCDHQKQ